MSEDFWLSDEGILLRTEDLARDFSFRVYNRALKGNFVEAGFSSFLWVAVVDAKTCDYCDSQNGRMYKSGQFLPRIPAHPNCRCLWDIYMRMEG